MHQTHQNMFCIRLCNVIQPRRNLQYIHWQI